MYTPIKRTANDSFTHLKRRIVGLERRVAYYQSEYGEMKLEKQKAEAERDNALDLRDSIERKLLCEVRDLREALEWYANADHYINLLDDDCGKRARDALAGEVSDD